MELRQLGRIVFRYLPVAILVFSLCVVAGMAAAFLPDKTYRTSATIVLDINNETDTGGASVQQAAFLLPAIETKARSRSLRERVVTEVPEQFRSIPVQLEAFSDVSVLTVRGTATSPTAAQAWVNAIADRLVLEQNTGDPAVILSVLDPAPVKRRPIAPNTEPLVVASVVVGLIAAVFAALAVDRLRTALRTPSDPDAPHAGPDVIYPNGMSRDVRPDVVHYPSEN